MTADCNQDKVRILNFELRSCPTLASISVLKRFLRRSRKFADLTINNKLSHFKWQKRVNLRKPLSLQCKSSYSKLYKGHPQRQIDGWISTGLSSWQKWAEIGEYTPRAEAFFVTQRFVVFFVTTVQLATTASVVVKWKESLKDTKQRYRAR